MAVVAASGKFNILHDGSQTDEILIAHLDVTYTSTGKISCDSSNNIRHSSFSGLERTNEPAIMMKNTTMSSVCYFL